MENNIFKLRRKKRRDDRSSQIISAIINFVLIVQLLSSITWKYEFNSPRAEVLPKVFGKAQH